MRDLFITQFDLLFEQFYVFFELWNLAQTLPIFILQSIDFSFELPHFKIMNFFEIFGIRWRSTAYPFDLVSRLIVLFCQKSYFLFELRKCLSLLFFFSFQLFLPTLQKTFGSFFLLFVSLNLALQKVLHWFHFFVLIFQIFITHSQCLFMLRSKLPVLINLSF